MGTRVALLGDRLSFEYKILRIIFLIPHTVQNYRTHGIQRIWQIIIGLLSTFIQMVRLSRVFTEIGSII
jgi:hypothetical protein